MSTTAHHTTRTLASVTRELQHALGGGDTELAHHLLGELERLAAAMAAPPVDGGQPSTHTVDGATDTPNPQTHRIGLYGLRSTGAVSSPYHRPQNAVTGLPEASMPIPEAGTRGSEQNTAANTVDGDHKSSNRNSHGDVAERTGNMGMAMTEQQYKQGLAEWVGNAGQALLVGDTGAVEYWLWRANRWREQHSDVDRRAEAEEQERLNRPAPSPDGNPFRTGYRNTATHEAR